MSTRFRPLFTFGVTHQYYGSGTCPDFDFILAQHSQRALAGARLLARMHAGKLHVLFEADDQFHPVQNIDGLELVIGLRLGNPYLEHFTDALPAPFPFYANATTPKTLDAPKTSALAAHHFTPDSWLPAPFALSVRRMRDNALVWSDNIQNVAAMPALDMRAWEAGCYLLTQQSGSKTTTRPLILAPDLAEAGIWGVARIVVTPDFWKPTSPPAFQVELNARAEKLNYYVVAPPNWSDFTKLSVIDSAKNSAIAFEKLDKSKFPSDGISSSLLGDPPAQVVLFRSKVPVLRSASALQHFQLRRSADTLIKSLPLPGAEMPSASFVVHLSKP